MHWTLTQNGSEVTGDAAFNDSVEGDHHGPFAGTVSGSMLTFNFSVGMGGQGCGNALSGTASVGATTLTGAWSGHNCAGGAISNGQLALSLQPGLRTQAFPVGGTWMSTTGTSGGGTWTWQLSEQVTDVNSSVLTGSVTVSGSDRLHLGSAAVTGGVANTFPGPMTVVTLNASFTGPCPSTVQLTEMLINNGSALNPGFSGGGATGSMCDGSTPIAFALRKQ
jgi:hypothetical protein